MFKILFSELKMREGANELKSSVKFKYIFNVNLIYRNPLVVFITFNKLIKHTNLSKQIRQWLKHFPKAHPPTGISKSMETDGD